MTSEDESTRFQIEIQPFRSIGVERWMNPEDVDQMKRDLSYYPVQRAVAVQMTEEQLSDMRKGHTDRVIPEPEIADMAICNSQVLDYALRSEGWPQGISVPERVKKVLDNVLEADLALQDLAANGWPEDSN